MIFAPIRHWGWRSACSTVTPAASRLRSRNAPPLHVTISRRTGARSPARHWNMAECSESIGTIGARCFRASGITQAPPTTSDSLLASAAFLPAPMAATVGASPAYPTSAFTTTSVSPAAARLRHGLLAGIHLRVGAGERVAQRRIVPFVGYRHGVGVELQGLLGEPLPSGCGPSVRGLRTVRDSPARCRASVRRSSRSNPEWQVVVSWS